MMTLGIVMAVLFMVGLAIIFVGHEFRDSALEEVEDELAELENEVKEEEEVYIWKYWLFVKLKGQRKPIKLMINTPHLIKDFYNETFPKDGEDFTVTSNGYRFESKDILWMNIKKRR